MRPYVKLRWPLVFKWLRHFINLLVSFLLFRATYSIVRPICLWMKIGLRVMSKSKSVSLQWCMKTFIIQWLDLRQPWSVDYDKRHATEFWPINRARCSLSFSVVSWVTGGHSACKTKTSAPVISIRSRLGNPAQPGITVEEKASF